MHTLDFHLNSSFFKSYPDYAGHHMKTSSVNCCGSTFTEQMLILLPNRWHQST